MPPKRHPKPLRASPTLPTTPHPKRQKRTKKMKQKKNNLIITSDELSPPPQENLKPIFFKFETIKNEEIDTDNNSTSVACQTDPLDVEYQSELICFSCTFRIENGFNTAEVQASLQTLVENSNKKDKQDEDFLIINNINNEEEIEYIDCGEVKMLMPPNIPGFYGYKSLDNDEKFIEFCGVTKTVFNLLLLITPDVDFGDITRENKLIIFLMKLKLSLTFMNLSVLFNVDCNELKQLFIIMAKCLGQKLFHHITWPSKNVVGENLPKLFYNNYRNSRVIIDIIEIQVEKNLSEKKALKDFDSRDNIKILIGYTPNGYICFKSKLYAAGHTDCLIINDSSILNLVQENDLVLSSRVYSHIKTGVESKRAIFSCPQMLIKNLNDCVFSNEQIVETEQVAIHIEKMIQKIKIFSVLKFLPSELLSLVDDILTIICGLNNLGSSSLSAFPNRHIQGNEII